MTDQGSIVAGWLAKLVVFLAIAGFLAYDVVAVGVANVRAANDATTAASAAADVFKTTKDVQKAYDAASALVQGNGETVETKTFTIDKSGAVTLTVDKEPHSLWMRHLGPTRKWTHVHQSGTAGPPLS